MTDALGFENFNKVLQKTVVRTKEKVLHSLGKADKTTDDDFDRHVQTFYDQQTAATRLQKEFKNYVTHVQGMLDASNNMYMTLRETHESEWPRHEEVDSSVMELHRLWTEYYLKLTEVQNPLTSYLANFADLKAKIAKHDRKVIDYDSARHNLQAVENAKRRDDVKLAKAQDQLTAAENIYKEMHRQLMTELPALYGSRVDFLGSHFTAILKADVEFHTGTAQTEGRLADIMLQLCKNGTPSVRRNDLMEKMLRPMPADATAMNNDRGDHRNSAPVANVYSPESPESKMPKSKSMDDGKLKGQSGQKPIDVDANKSQNAVRYSDNPYEVVRDSDSSDEEDRHAANKVVSPAHKAEVVYSVPQNKSSSTPQMNGGVMTEPVETRVVMSTAVVSKDAPVDFSSDSDSDVGSRPVQTGRLSGVTPTAVITASRQNGHDSDSDTAGLHNGKLSPHKSDSNFLYKVRAIHPYAGEDDDELMLEIGDTVRVIEYEDPDDQDEGWLMGISESTGKKGVFPANFTKRL